MKAFFSKLGFAFIGLVGVAGISGCGASTATPDDLARSVVAFLADNDFDGYLASTVMTSDQFFALCPAGGSYDFDVANYRDEFNDCREAFDFTNATVTTVSPSLETLPAHSKDCGNEAAIKSADSIEVTIKSDGGTFKFKIDDSVETADGWRQADQLRCSTVTAGSGGSSGGI